MKGFWSEKKVKTRDEDGNVLVYNGFSHVRKYDDAIKWGAKTAGADLQSMDLGKGAMWILHLRCR